MASKFNTTYYDTAVKEYQNKAKADLAQQTQQAQASAGSQLQQAYIQRMQNQNALNNQLRQAGIRGGATETSNLNLLNTYNANRNTINSDLAGQLNTLNTNYNDNVFNYKQQMETAKEEARQNWQAQQDAYAREDKENASAKRTEYFTAKYSTSYNVKELQKKLAKAKTNEEKNAIRNRIAYIKQHKKGY